MWYSGHVMLVRMMNICIYGCETIEWSVEYMLWLIVNIDTYVCASHLRWYEIVKNTSHLRRYGYTCIVVRMIEIHAYGMIWGKVRKVRLMNDWKVRKCKEYEENVCVWRLSWAESLHDLRLSLAKSLRCGHSCDIYMCVRSETEPGRES